MKFNNLGIFFFNLFFKVTQRTMVEMAICKKQLYEMRVTLLNTILDQMFIKKQLIDINGSQLKMIRSSLISWI